MGYILADVALMINLFMKTSVAAIRTVVPVIDVMSRKYIFLYSEDSHSCTLTKVTKYKKKTVFVEAFQRQIENCCS